MADLTMEEIQAWRKRLIDRWQDSESEYPAQIDYLCDMALRSLTSETNTQGEPNRDVSAGTSHSESDGLATKPTTSRNQDGASQGTAPILSAAPSPVEEVETYIRRLTLEPELLVKKCIELARRLDELKICTGCGRRSDAPPIPSTAIACCPDNRYRSLEQLLEEARAAEAKLSECMGHLREMYEKLSEPGDEWQKDVADILPLMDKLNDLLGFRTAHSKDST